MLVTSFFGVGSFSQPMYICVEFEPQQRRKISNSCPTANFFTVISKVTFIFLLCSYILPKSENLGSFYLVWFPW